MQQFHPFPTFQDEIEDTGPLRTDTPVKNTQPDLDTLSLLTALQSTMTASNTGRMVVIPGAKKRNKTSKKISTTSRRRVKSRLRFIIVCGIILIMLGYTLLSLSPLAAGQGSFPGLSGFGNFIREQATNLAYAAHLAPPAQQQQPTTTQGSTTLPPVTLPKSQYIAIAQQDATDAGISPVYFVRQINQESGFNPNAVSPAGAVGIAQFEPGTAAGLGIDPWNPVQALRAAAQLMANYNRMYGGDYAKALAAYNGGTGTVQYAVNNCGANWLNCLPGETRHYIYVIMGI
ncbi:MAG TPA: lytic transglycosylase domain-containing protein [Ktedonobacteraceae bacterium]|nr:lytic transglycosylase domain-containing protein [Ktedonobacteraceae bacterium]